MKSFGAKTLAFPAPVWVVGTYDKDSNGADHFRNDVYKRTGY